jgi:hypothetical protein
MSREKRPAASDAVTVAGLTRARGSSNGPGYRESYHTPDGGIFDLARRLRDADVVDNAAIDGLTIVDKVMHRWAARNPKPAMRECWVGTTAEWNRYMEALMATDNEQEIARLKAEVDSNRDLKVAADEWQDAVKIWSKRKATAEAQCRYHETKQRETDACRRAVGACEALTAGAAVTLQGMILKARLASKFRDNGLAWSVISDLEEMSGGRRP